MEEHELEAEAFPGGNSRGNAVSRVLAAMDAKGTRPDAMDGPVRLRPSGVDSGPGREGRVLLDTGIQINVRQAASEVPLVVPLDRPPHSKHVFRRADGPSNRASRRYY